MSTNKITLTLICGAKVQMDPSKVYRVEPTRYFTRVYYLGNQAKKSDCYAVQESVVGVNILIGKE